MTRADLPYVVLIVFFGVVVFFAGRYSVPTPAAPEPRVLVVHDATPAPPPSVVVIASPPEPPMALLPEVAPIVAAAPQAPKVGIVEQPKLGPVPTKTSAPTPAASIFLEETLDVPPNPYKTSNTPGF